MPNVDKRNGFNLLLGGGKAPRRMLRTTNVASALSLMAPGDGYVVADNVITRVASGSVPVNGVMEAVALPGAAIGEGPTTYDYVPASTGLNIIGIEDTIAVFECTASIALAITIYDGAPGAASILAIADTAPNIPLRQSRQAVGTTGTDGMLLLAPIDRVGNDPYAVFARVAVKLRPVNVL
jgi:hypothetical protein